MNWDATFARRKWGGYPDMALVRAVAWEFPGSRDGLKALEVGCGPGANLWFLARSGFQVTGLDSSIIALNQADALVREMTGAAPRLLPLDVAGGSEIPGSYDLIVDVCCLQHVATDVPSASRVLSRLAGRLNPGGVLFSKWLQRGSDLTTLEYPTRSLSECEVHDVFSTAGLSCEVDSLVETRNRGSVSHRHWLITAKRLPA